MPKPPQSSSFKRRANLHALICRGAHVRLDVREIISMDARKAVVDAVVVNQESKVAVAFVRMPGPRMDHASVLCQSRSTPYLTLFCRKC